VSEDTEDYDLPITDEGPTEDVDIEITEDDLGESLADYDVDEPEEDQVEEEGEPVEEEAVEEEAPKRKRSRDNRIAELARKAADAERRAQEAEARVQQAEQLRQQSDFAMMTHYEKRIHGQADVIKQQLIDAHSIGDSEKIVELQQEFYKLQSDLNGIESWKAQQELTPPEPKKATQPRPAAQPTLEPRTADWIGKNTWFQPQSSDFDPEMHEEATIYARRIERRYRSEGREDEIGGLDYFTEIDRHMQGEFPDAFSERSVPSKRVPPMSRESNVAPVQRTGNPGQPTKQSKTIRLTADQRRMAHQLAQSGAIKKAGGGRMSELEAEKHYAVYLMKQGKGA
jgi:hypothetical protein